MKRTNKIAYLVIEDGHVIHVTPSKLYAEKVVRMYRKLEATHPLNSTYTIREMTMIVGDTPEEQQ